MSDGITVSSGGAISVDTELLRGVARQIDAIAPFAHDAAVYFNGAWIDQEQGGFVPPSYSGWALSMHALMHGDETERDANDLRLCADLYEAVELSLVREARSLRDCSADARLNELFAGNPWLRMQVDTAIRMWKAGVGSELFDQIFNGTGIWAFGPIVWMPALGSGLALRLSLGSIGRGAVPFGTRLRGPMPQVTVVPHGQRSEVTAPQGYADMIDRVPTTGETRVTVETYTGADGKPITFIYVSGTRGDGPADEAWTWPANVDAYMGREQSTAYAAVMAAIAAAGVNPGDRIVLVGYSQGGMLTELISASGLYDVVFSQSVGSPVEAEVSDTTTHVQFIHDDDPMTLLRDGGLGGSSGDENSTIIERTAHPDSSGDDLSVPGHHLDEYRKTAEEADASTDPRLQGGRDVLRNLTNGRPGTRRDYGASVDGE